MDTIPDVPSPVGRFNVEYFSDYANAWSFIGQYHEYQNALSCLDREVETHPYRIHRIVMIMEVDGFPRD